MEVVVKFGSDHTRFPHNRLGPHQHIWQTNSTSFIMMTAAVVVMDESIVCLRSYQILLSILSCSPSVIIQRMSTVIDQLTFCTFSQKAKYDNSCSKVSRFVSCIAGQQDSSCNKSSGNVPGGISSPEK